MSDLSKQLHSITFTDESTGETKNTWDDWQLIPSSRPSFATPKLKEYTQDIPGANGKIDMSSALTGYPAYDNRTGSIEFLVMNQGLDTDLGDSYGYNIGNSAWSVVKASIMNWIHGKKLRVEYSDAPNWYFIGRIKVNEWKSSANYSSITLDYDLEPFRYSITSTSDLWLWDPFSFVDGVIRTYSENNMKFDTAGTKFTIIGTVTPVVPTISVTNACTLKTNKGTFKLKAGSSKDPLIMIYPGKQEWEFSGASGSAAVFFRERSF